VAFQADQLYFATPGGIGTYIRNLIPAMTGLDPSLELTLFHARFADATDAPESWMSAHDRIQIDEGIRTLYPRWALMGRPALPAALASTDVVHASSSAGVPPAGRGQRLVVTVHDLAFLVAPRMFPTSWKWMYRLGLRGVKRADAIITPSRSTAEDLVSRTGVDPAKVNVVPEASSLPIGAADPAEVASRLRLRAPYLLFVGTLEPRKNLVPLVRAYRRAAADGLPLSLVLAGPMGWHGDALMRELALEGPGEITLTGYLPASDLDAVYRGASAFAYPSTYEGFGLPVLEAMSRGIPVITSSVSSLPEVAGEAALLVDPSSVHDLQGAISRLTGDAALSARLAEGGRSRAAGFTWGEAARLTLDVYASVMR
jgi:glycosyltransferase involved in cell wall biosynthesis